jgi:hypothetical protein
MKKALVVTYPFGVHSIFLATLAKMFAEFQERLNSSELIYNSNVKRELIVCFQETFQAAIVADGSKPREENQDSIEALAELSHASNIERHFRNLFEKTGFYVSFEIAPLYQLNEHEKRMITKIEMWQENDK